MCIDDILSISVPGSGHAELSEGNQGVSFPPPRVYSRTVPRSPQPTDQGYPRSLSTSPLSTSPLSTDRSGSTSPVRHTEIRDSEALPSYPGLNDHASTHRHPGTNLNGGPENHSALPCHPENNREASIHPGSTDQGPSAHDPLLEEMPPPPYPGPPELAPPPSYYEVVNTSTEV